VQAYLPEQDLAIAVTATLGESVPEGTRGGFLVFQAVAAALVPEVGADAGVPGRPCARARAA